jgi:hypothetical protein
LVDSPALCAEWAPRRMVAIATLQYIENKSHFLSEPRLARILQIHP